MMGCTQVRVIPDHSPNQIRSTRSRNSQNIIDQSPTTIFDRLSVTPVTWNQSENLNQHSPTVLLRSSDNRETTLNRHSILTSSSMVIERKDTPISHISIIKPFDLNSNISDIPEVSSMSIASSEFNPRPCLMITSSTDVNQKVYYQDAIKRFLSSRPKRPINHPTSRYKNTWNRPNKSHNDVINSLSTYSGESASDLAKDISTTSIRPRQYKTIVKDTDRIAKKISSSSEKRMTLSRSKNARL